jgi:hypothetical protein
VGLSKIEALKWTGAFGRGFSRTTAPYYGVNIFDVRPEHLEAVVANVGVQKRLAKRVGGEPESWSERDNGGLVRVEWIMSYPNGVNSHGSGPLAIWRMRSFFSTWFEFCGLIESYEWFLTTELSSDAGD